MIVNKSTLQALSFKIKFCPLYVTIILHTILPKFFISLSRPYIEKPLTLNLKPLFYLPLPLKHLIALDKPFWKLFLVMSLFSILFTFQQKLIINISPNQFLPSLHEFRREISLHGSTLLTVRL